MGAAQRRRANRSAKEFIAWAERQRATGACGMFYWPRIHSSCCRDYFDFRPRPHSR